MGPEFTPERVADLTALAAASRTAGPPQPFSSPIVIDDRGYAWVPHPDPFLGILGIVGNPIGCYVHAGLRLGWAPMPLPPPGGVLLTLFGGPRAESGFEEDGVAAFITRDGLNGLIADLQAIAASIALPSTDDQEGQG
jgi:hypothetical protein